MRQAKIVVALEHHQLLPHAVLTLAQGVDPPPHRVVYLYRAGNSVACKKGIMPPFHHHGRGQRDGITPLFLPAGAGGSARALLHVAGCVAQRARRRPTEAPPASPTTPQSPP